MCIRAAKIDLNDHSSQILVNIVAFLDVFKIDRKHIAVVLCERPNGVYNALERGRANLKTSQNPRYLI
jgi:hypothetical protein